MADKHFVGEVGTLIKVDLTVDVSGGTGPKIYVAKPDGTTVEWTATINTQYLEYTIIAGDFDVAGKYCIQGGVTTGAWTGRGETTSFIVYDDFEDCGE